MNDIKQTSNPHEDLLSFFNYTSIGTLYNLTPLFFSEENQQALDELIGVAKVELIDFLEGIESERALKQSIELWRNEDKSTKATRVIVKLINNTPHTFKIAQTSLPLHTSERQSFQTSPSHKNRIEIRFRLYVRLPLAQK